MKKQYVKVPLNEEVFEAGGASVVFANKETIPLDGAIDEALLGNYVIGQKNLIYNTFLGLMRSMCDGIQRDGKARQLGDFITLYPVLKGPIDLEKGFDPEVNKVIVRCNLLNEMVFDLDQTKWSLEDVTPGKRAFTLETASTGVEDGVYTFGSQGHINGRNLPSTVAGDDLRVEWEVAETGKSGEVATLKRSSDISRINIDADALTGLDATDDGKKIVFTVRGNFSNAKIAATLIVPPEPPTITKLNLPDEDSLNTPGDAFSIEGTGLEGVTSVTYVNAETGAEIGTESVSWADGKLNGETTLEVLPDAPVNAKIKLVAQGVTLETEEFLFTCH